MRSDSVGPFVKWHRDRWNEHVEWWQLVMQLKASVVPRIWLQVVLFAAWGTFISFLYNSEFPVRQPVLGNLIPSIVLGLLLVFRTNTAYSRYWEGRKLWGAIVHNSCNLARQIWMTFYEESDRDRAAKLATLHFIPVFVLAVKQFLRGHPPEEAVGHLVSPQQLDKLRSAERPHVEVIFWISDYLQHNAPRSRIGPPHVSRLFVILDTLTLDVGGCERILRTPLPLAYAVHLKHVLFAYCLLLPFQIVGELSWLTGLGTGLICFALFGIEAIGLEIENPFGCDPNDLPLDTFCIAVENYVEALVRSGEDSERG